MSIYSLKSEQINFDSGLGKGLFLFEIKDLLNRLGSNFVNIK